MFKRNVMSLLHKQSEELPFLLFVLPVIDYYPWRQEITNCIKQKVPNTMKSYSKRHLFSQSKFTHLSTSIISQNESYDQDSEGSVEAFNLPKVSKKINKLAKSVKKWKVEVLDHWKKLAYSLVF